MPPPRRSECNQRGEGDGDKIGVFPQYAAITACIVCALYNKRQIRKLHHLLLLPSPPPLPFRATRCNPAAPPALASCLTFVVILAPGYQTAKPSKPRSTTAAKHQPARAAALNNYTRIEKIRPAIPPPPPGACSNS